MDIIKELLYFRSFMKKSVIIADCNSAIIIPFTQCLNKNLDIPLIRIFLEFPKLLIMIN